MKHFARKLFPPLQIYYASQVRKRIITDSQKTDLLISSLIEAGNPAMVGRIGACESAALSCFKDRYTDNYSKDPITYLYNQITSQKRFIQLRDLAGVYPINKSQLKIFYYEFVKSIYNSDILGCWGETFTAFEKFAIGENRKLIPQASTSPWILDSHGTPGGWSKSLEGKKVLVVSPFSDLFTSQYKNKENIYKNSKLPEFEIIALKAPLTQGGLNDGSTWETNLGTLKRQADNFNFDVALISAGSYANPLASYIKDIGKIGINCGGELQIFFGVLGRRWEKAGRHMRYINNHWVRPSDDLKPSNWETIEGGCYW